MAPHLGRHAKCQCRREVSRVARVLRAAAFGRRSSGARCQSSGHVLPNHSARPRGAQDFVALARGSSPRRWSYGRVRGPGQRFHRSRGTRLCGCQGRRRCARRRGVVSQPSSRAWRPASARRPAILFQESESARRSSGVRASVLVIWAGSQSVGILCVLRTGSSPIESISSCKVVKVGETIPRSIRLIAACVVPARSASRR